MVGVFLDELVEVFSGLIGHVVLVVVAELNFVRFQFLFYDT